MRPQVVQPQELAGEGVRTPARGIPCEGGAKRSGWRGCSRGSCRMIQGKWNDAPADATTPTTLIWSGSTVSTEPTGPSPRRYPPNDQADRPGGACGTRSRPARPPAPEGASASRRSGDSAVAHGMLGTAAADPNTAQDARRVRRVVPRRARQRVRLVLGWRPPARFLGADDSRETVSERGDSARRPPPPRTPWSSRPRRRGGRHVRHGAPGRSSATSRRA